MGKRKTLIEVADLYQASPEWRRLAVRTKVIYGNGLKSLAEFHDTPLHKITRPWVIQYRDKHYDSPGKLRVALNTLSNLFRFAYDRGWVEHNPAKQVSGLPPKRPYARWEDDEINLFLRTAPDHLQQALALALYTGQRRSDLVRMRWTDYDGKTIHVIQKKTGKELFIPVHPRLKAMLHIVSKRPLMPFIIANSHGDPWAADSLRDAVTRHARKIGLKNRSIHGVRKSTASILAEMGCTPHQIMSITGQGLQEVENYTKAANQKKLAVAAMEQWA